MLRIDTATRFIDKFGPGKHGFRDGDPLAAILATRLIAKWFDHVQEQIARFVEGAGIALDENDFDQLSAAFDARLADYFAGLGNIAFLDVEQVWTKAQGSAALPLVEAAPVAINTALSNLFTLGLTASRTLGNPSNVVLGRPFAILIQQPVGGGCGLAFDANWQFENDEAPANTTTPNAIDLLIGIGMPAGKVFGHLKQNIL